MKRVPPELIVSIICGLLLSARLAPAQNLAANPGFETGNTAGWSPFGSPTISATTAQVHTGFFAGMVTNRTATYMGISQSFLGVMQSNQTYNVSIWLRLAGGTSETMQVTAQKIDGGGTSYAVIASGTVTSGSWTQLSGQYTLSVSGALTGLAIYFEMPSSNSNAYFADDFVVQAMTPPGTNGPCIVDWGTTYQRIDGFGASSAWRSTWTATQADMFFSTNASGTTASFDGRTNFTYAGIGLSLLRSRIAPGGTTVENSIMQMAQARGARVWSTPWSPAATFKSNGNVNGGSFVGSAANYQAYASQLAGYVANMKNTYGVNLYAISVQNEPDANVTTYESCNWSAQQIHDFVPYLHAALVASNAAATKIMLPESQNWLDYSNLTATALGDSTSNDVAIVGDHNYDGLYGPSSLVKNAHGKALWETEVSLLSGSDSSITNGVYYAGRIHDFLTIAQVNAWHYWWLFAYSTGNAGLTDTNGVPARRMYALGQYSRFVRPNYYRIAVTGNTGTALISAYKDSLSPGFAIVAVNSNSAAITQTFYLTNAAAVSNVTPWVTTSDLSLTNQPVVLVTNSSFTYTLPAMSIVTFAGQTASNATPVLSISLPAAGQASITVNGPQGPDYLVLVSSNLATWQVLFSTNSPMLPVVIQTTNPGNLPGQFFRAQLGP